MRRGLSPGEFGGGVACVRSAALVMSQARVRCMWEALGREEVSSMALTLEDLTVGYKEFRKVVERERAMLEAGNAPGGVAVCNSCNTPLMETKTGNRRLGDGTHVCSDCYFHDWGNEIESHPIVPPRSISVG